MVAGCKGQCLDNPVAYVGKPSVLDYHRLRYAATSGSMNGIASVCRPRALAAQAFHEAISCAKGRIRQLLDVG